MMEKRFYPRVVGPFSAVVEDESGISLNVIAQDASSNGLCIQCNIRERNLVTPGGSFVRDGKPLELLVWLALPLLAGGVEQIAIHCHVAYSRRVSNNRCEIGMRYTQINTNAQKILMEYIESASVSNDYCSDINSLFV